MEKVFVVFADTEKKEEEELEFLELVKACDFQIEAIFSQLLKSITLKPISAVENVLKYRKPYRIAIYHILFFIRT